MVTKWKNRHSHKIITRINQIESKYGNKIGCELEANLSADQSHIFYKSKNELRANMERNYIKLQRKTEYTAKKETK